MSYSEKEQEILKSTHSKKVNDNNFGEIAEHLYNSSDDLENFSNLLTEVNQQAPEAIARTLDLISKIFDNSDEQTKLILQSNVDRLNVLSKELESGNLTTEQRLANVKESADIRAESYAFKKDQDRHRLATIAAIGTIVVGVVGTVVKAVTNDSEQPVDTTFTD